MAAALRRGTPSLKAMIPRLEIQNNISTDQAVGFVCADLCCLTEIDFAMRRISRRPEDLMGGRPNRGSMCTDRSVFYRRADGWASEGAAPGRGMNRADWLGFGSIFRTPPIMTGASTFGRRLPAPQMQSTSRCSESQRTYDARHVRSSFIEGNMAVAIKRQTYHEFGR